MSFKVAKEKKGITLIALVITIIVLLILAGISISMLTGQNGILNRAQEAKEKTEDAVLEEKIKLAMAEAQIGDNEYQKLDITNLTEALNKQFEGRNLQISDNGDGSYIISLDNNSKMFYADSDGKLISNENMVAIDTAEELKTFRDDVNSGNTYEGKYVYLTKDIILDIDEEWEPIGVYLNDASTPEDEGNIAFKGIFIGNGHEINGIKINANEKVKGFFAFVSDGGKVLNLGIGADNSINGILGTAGLVGYLNNGASVSNCYNKANITGDGNSIGGVVAICVDSNIKNCYNTGIIESTQGNAGGISGMSNNSTITDSCNLGTITAIEAAGIVSINTLSKIYKCYNVGEISSNTKAGGITVSNSGELYLCYNIGNVTSIGDYVGGITASNSGTLYDCYNSQNTIQGQRYIGGICGWNQKGEIYNCYNSGNITGIYSVSGGIIGANNAIVKNCYFLENRINNGNGIAMEGIIQKTNEEIKEIYSLLSNNFRKDTENINQGYPILNWQ